MLRGFPFAELLGLTPCCFELCLFLKVQWAEGIWKTYRGKTLKFRHFVFNLLVRELLVKVVPSLQPSSTIVVCLIFVEGGSFFLMHFMDVLFWHKLLNDGCSNACWSSLLLVNLLVLWSKCSNLNPQVNEDMSKVKSSQ
jgi:hypothetical protein